MQALVLRDDTEAAVLSAKALLNKGFHVVCVENRHIARALLRAETFDLLVLDERITGRLTHSIALAAERRYPYINTILLTERIGPEVDELYDLIPCVYAIASLDCAPDLLAKLALSSIESFEQAEARVKRNLRRVGMDESAFEAMVAAEDEADDLPDGGIHPAPDMDENVVAADVGVPTDLPMHPALPTRPLDTLTNPILISGTQYFEQQMMDTNQTEVVGGKAIEDTFEFAGHEPDEVSSTDHESDPAEEDAALISESVSQNGLATKVMEQVT